MSKESLYEVPGMALCTPCAKKMEEIMKLTLVQGGINMKITCENCGRRKYGAYYEKEGKKK